MNTFSLMCLFCGIVIGAAVMGLYVKWPDEDATESVCIVPPEKHMKPMFYLFRVKDPAQNHRIFKDELAPDDDPLKWIACYSADPTKQLEKEMEAYKVALQHIANGHTNPQNFAKVLLNIGKEE